MSDGAQVLEEGFGTPLVWIFDHEGEPLLNKDGSPMARYITDFDYTYDEESDDLCNITLEFDDITQFENKSVQKDIKLEIQWGYLVGNGTFIKSPKRKIAVRDISRKYRAKKLSVELKCTDLVSYIKLNKSTSVRQYQNANVDQEQSALGDFNDNFIDWLAEVSEGNFIPTITHKGKAIRKDYSGTMINFDYNEKTGEYTRAADNLRVKKEMYLEFHVAKIIKGKSKSIQNAIDDQLKWLEAQSGGGFIASSTDDNLHIFQRNFKQNIYRVYTFAQSTGELIEFDSDTDTRKTKKNVAATSDVDPYTKEIVTNEVNMADTSDAVELGQGITLADGKVDQEMVDAWLKKVRTVFKHNIENPDDQKEVPDFDYISIAKLKADPLRDGPYNKLASGKKTIQAKEFLNLPEFMDLARENNSAVKAKHLKEQVLTGFLVDKLQKKYTAKAKVVGDPSLIKSKIYGFYGLHSIDNGRWYATKVTHTINNKSGYTTELDLIKQPLPISINKAESVEKINPKENTNSQSVDGFDFKALMNEVVYEELFIYKEVNKEGEEVYRTAFDDNTDLQEAYRGTGKVEAARERIRQLNAEEDYIMGREETQEIEPSELIKNLREEAKKVLKQKNADRY